jgi:LacI family transcriptional regulator, galactose operon repressor
MVLDPSVAARPASREMNRFARSSRVTIADVAARAGVSKTTVSHVLSGKRPVGAATRTRVERAIDDLQYRPNAIARSLRTSRSHMVALVIPDITNPFFPVLARGFEDALAADGYRSFVCNTDSMRDQEIAFIGDVVARRVDGLAVVSRHVHAEDLAGLLEVGVGFVSIGSMIVDHPAVDVVMGDDERGAYDATRFLLGRYGERVACISGSDEGPQARQIGYRRAMADAGVAVDERFVVEGDWTRAGGAAAMRELLSHPDRPRAVFCSNDLMALGALDVAHESGLRVPEDVALIGYDDVEWAGLIRPPLTTVVNPAYDTGRAAASLLLDRVSDGYEGARRVMRIGSSLVVRESA